MRKLLNDEIAQIISKIVVYNLFTIARYYKN